MCWDNLAEKYANNVIYISGLNKRCVELCFLVETIIVNVISCYAPQSALPAEEKGIPSAIKLLAKLQQYQMKRCYLVVVILMGMLVSILQGLKVFMGVMVMVG